jgi:bifunctional non-homologous end joining protein LigD
MGRPECWNAPRRPRSPVIWTPAARGLYLPDMFRTRPCRPSSASFIEPCLPSNAPRPPVGDQWLHEIKQDGFRLMARRDAAGIRLLTRNGHDWTSRFPQIAAAVNALRCRSCLIDGEAVCCDDAGVAIFDLLRRRANGGTAFLYAFDLLELDGKDLRREPIEARKAALAELAFDAKPGLQLSVHLDHPGTVVFEHACKLGLEGIVSKRRGSRYESGRSSHWLKSKNPNHAAVTRLLEEDWNG